MVEMIRYPSAQAESRLARIADRKMGADPSREKQVLEMLEAVRRRGDSALVEYTRRFDAPGFEAEQLTVGQEEIEAAPLRLRPGVSRGEKLDEGGLRPVGRALDAVGEQLRPSGAK